MCVCICVYIDWNDTIDKFYEMSSQVSWLENATGSHKDDGLSRVNMEKLHVV